MLLALDESLEGQIPCVGLVGTTWEDYFAFEQEVLKLRVANHVWAEFGWKKVSDNSYLSKYISFIDLFFSFTSMAFFCWTFEKPEKNILERFFSGDSSLPYHKTAYGLVRNVSRKIAMGNQFSKEPVYLLPDSGTPKGQEGWKKTKELLEKDKKMPLKVEACCQTNSAVCALVQITDILTGASHYEINNMLNEPGKIKLYEHILEKNNGERFFLEQTRPLAPYGTYKTDCMHKVHYVNINTGPII